LDKKRLVMMQIKEKSRPYFFKFSLYRLLPFQMNLR